MKIINDVVNIDFFNYFKLLNIIINIFFWNFDKMDYNNHIEAEHEKIYYLFNNLKSILPL